MTYLTEEEIVAINLYVIQRFSPNEQTGLQSPESLHLALDRLQQAGEDPETRPFSLTMSPMVLAKAGAILESLVQNPPFLSGNNRTAFLSLLQFLEYNGYRFTMDPKHAKDFVMEVYDHSYSMGVIEIFINSQCRQVGPAIRY